MYRPMLWIPVFAYSVPVATGVLSQNFKFHEGAFPILPLNETLVRTQLIWVSIFEKKHFVIY